ncbi:MAG: hypothetical protein H6Q35_376 [Proteobacteria bacterium]|nr:hypothetical protein [Pseudomonadota bacterium]
MIPKKYEFIVFAFLMSFFMTLLMSFMITFINIGLVEDFLVRWLGAFWRAYIIAFPSVLTVVPIVRKIVRKLVAQH